MNATIEQINRLGHAFVEFALPMLIQSGVLILILLFVDLLLRKKVRAVFRYWMWMLALVKLLLPTSLSSPVSLGRWFGDELAYVDTIPEPAAEPEIDIASPPVMDIPRLGIRPTETITHAPAVVPLEPTPPPLEPAPPFTPFSPFSPFTPSSPSTSLSWQGAALLNWLAVLTAMALLLFQRALFVRRLVAQAGKANRPMIDALVHSRQRMLVNKEVALKISASATSPAVCGLVKPVILVPENLTPSLSSDEFRVVLLHELAHIKRRDLWVNLAQTLLQIFYFYNPLLWLANTMIRRAREQAVDEMVLVAMGDKARQYPETLVNVAKLAFKRPALSLRLIGVVESKSALTGRIKHILGRPVPKTAKLGILGLVVVVLAAALLLPMARSMKPQPSVVNNGPLDIRLVGVRPDGGEQLYDASGQKLDAIVRAPGLSISTWSEETQRRDFVLEFPDVNDDVLFLSHARIRPAGTDMSLAVGYGHYWDLPHKASSKIYSANVPRAYRRRVALFFRPEVSVRLIDLTVRYFYGPRRQAKCTFTGPFAMDKTFEADGSRPYSLTFERAPDDDELGIRLRLVAKETFSDDTPGIIYDLDGARYLVRPGSGSSQGGWAELKYDGVSVTPDKIAAITFGEKPHEITFKNVAVHYPDRPYRSYAGYLDQVAERLDLTGLSGKQLFQYDFKSPQEAIEVIDVVRGDWHIRKALEAIRYSRPKTNISELDQATKDRIRRAATDCAGINQVAKYGIQFGLMGQWPEFFDMAIARLSEATPRGRPYNERRRRQGDNDIANVMLNFRMNRLTGEQVNALTQVIRETDSGTVSRSLLYYLDWTKSQATTDALWELAQDDRPWIWWQAIDAWYSRESRTRQVFDDLPEKVKLRLFLIRGVPDDESLKAQARTLLLQVFTPEMGKMAGSTWYDIAKRITREFDKRDATQIYVEYLRQMRSEMTARQWISNDAFKRTATSTAVYAMRILNVWYGSDIGNLGTAVGYGPPHEKLRTFSQFDQLIGEALAWHDGNAEATPVELPLAGKVVDTAGKPIARCRSELYKAGEL